MDEKKFVWDKVVRSVHWIVAIAVFANLFATPPGSPPHQVLGYVALGLVVLRLLWSFTGAKKPARFRDLMPTVSNAKHHLQDLQRGEDTAEPGHNAFGLLAVWAMWLCIIALAFTGYHAAGETDLYYDYNLDDWHEVIANILLAIVGLHILAVIATGWRVKRNLIRPMIHK